MGISVLLQEPHEEWFPAVTFVVISTRAVGNNYRNQTDAHCLLAHYAPRACFFRCVKRTRRCRSDYRKGIRCQTA